MFDLTLCPSPFKMTLVNCQISLVLYLMKFNPSLQQMELDITIVYLTIMKLLFFSNTCTAFPQIICTEASWTLLFVFFN